MVSHFVKAPAFSFLACIACLFAQCLGTSAFNPTSQTNLAVYFGHSPGASTANLLDLCADSNIDTINIGFIRSFTGSAGYPTLDFVKSCKTPSTGTTSAKSAMINCPELAHNISTCQQAGKKVILSIGGSTSNTTFTSSSQASNAANFLWKTFGPDVQAGAWRPLGGAIVDGFDLDQESGSGDYYDVFASTFRSLYKNTTAKAMYLSSTHSCANLANSTSLVTFVDFIYVRFYNAKRCNPGSSGFVNTLSAWLNKTDSIVGSSTALPKIYLGALSFLTTGSGFVTADAFPTYVSQAQKLKPSRFGGVMLWDGTQGQLTTNSKGQTYVAVAKSALLAG